MNITIINCSDGSPRQMIITGDDGNQFVRWWKGCSEENAGGWGPLISLQPTETKSRFGDDPLMRSCYNHLWDAMKAGKIQKIIETEDYAKVPRVNNPLDVLMLLSMSVHEDSFLGKRLREVLVSLRDEKNDNRALLWSALNELEEVRKVITPSLQAKVAEALQYIRNVVNK